MRLRVLPWTDPLTRFQRVLVREWARSRNVQTPGPGVDTPGYYRVSLRDNIQANSLRFEET